MMSHKGMTFEHMLNYENLVCFTAKYTVDFGLLYKLGHLITTGHHTRVGNNVVAMDRLDTVRHTNVLVPDVIETFESHLTRLVLVTALCATFHDGGNEKKKHVPNSITTTTTRLIVGAVCLRHPHDDR